MLLCAGLSERMLPLTRSVPKPALPLLGVPMALGSLRRLARMGVERVAVNVHLLPEVLPAVLDGADGLPQVEFLVERELLGTGGGIRNAAHALRGDGPFVVLNGDFVSDIDLAAALETHRRSGCPATLVLVDERPGYSVVETDAAGRVLSLAGLPRPCPERAAGRHVFTGFQILDEEVLDRIPATGKSDIVRDVHAALAAERRLAAHVHEGFWWELGTPRGYLEGSLALLALSPEQRAAVVDTDAVREECGARVALGCGAQREDDVRLAGGVALGRDSRVGSATTLRDVVVLPGARVERGARLRESVIGTGAVVPAGARLECVVACAAGGAPDRLPPGTERRDGLLVRPL